MQQKQRTYKEIMDDVQQASSGKEMRELHKELRQHKNHYGGLPMFMRYPNLPYIVSAISMIIVIAITTVKIILH